MGSWDIWRFLSAHPLARRNRLRAVLRVLRWQAGARLFPGGIVVPFVDDSRLLVERGMAGATGNVYAGLHEFEDMAFVLHVLRESDLFVDVGANVGAYSIMAAARGAQCMAFEPVAAARVHLERNVHLNGFGDRIEVHASAVGRASGVVRMTNELDTVNHILGDGETSGIDVPVVRLDDALSGKSPMVIKVDVEGFETEVLAGATQLLKASPPLAIIMEVNGSGQRYGFEDEPLIKTLSDSGYVQCAYDPFSRMLAPRPHASQAGNVLFVQDVALAQERVRQARPFTVSGDSI